MFAVPFIGFLVLAIFAVDFGKRWWHQNEWKRHGRVWESEER